MLYSRDEIPTCKVVRKCYLVRPSIRPQFLYVPRAKKHLIQEHKKVYVKLIKSFILLPQSKHYINLSMFSKIHYKIEVNSLKHFIMAALV